METGHIPQGEALQPAEERALFQKVWQRVTESGGGESPIEVLPPGEVAECGAPPPVPAPAADRGIEEACGELRGALRAALEAAGAYTALSRRLGGRPGNQRLRSLALRSRRRSKRLAVACFLLDGVWYLPQNTGGQGQAGTLMGALRERDLAERRSEEGCRSAAARAGDRDLAGLWLDLADESRESAQMVRQLLEEL